MSATATKTMSSLTEKLKEDTSRARVARAQLIADEEKAWTRYAHAVADVVEQLERDLAEGKATLAEQRAERKAATAKAVERARGALDELPVQGDLLAMEARDRLAPAREAVCNALVEARATIEHLTQALNPRR
jgi:hypothetical protein